jgi:hypothetical protein
MALRLKRMLIKFAKRWWSHHYSLTAPWKHGAHRVKIERTSPRGSGGHCAFSNGADRCTQ